MKKLFISFMMASFLFFTNCTSVENQQQDQNQLDLLKFVNTNLEQNNSNLKVSSIATFSLSNYDFYTEQSIIKDQNRGENSQLLEPYSLSVDVNNETYNLHTVPDSETHATIFIESENKQFTAVIEVDVSDYNPIDDTYTVTWSERSSSGKKHDCKTGAGTVAAVGRVIAFGTFFGCVPCAFVGGAISVLGSLGYIGCVVKGV